MTRDWEPGDVAMVMCSDGQERRALFGQFWLDDSGVWVFRDGTRRNADESQARPLVVIDAEDREQVERLAREYTLLHNYAGKAWEDREQRNRDFVIDSLAAALREFANPTPPRPEEPMGKWAVVEAFGVIYVRAAWGSDKPWSRVGTDRFDAWHEMDATEVLSEGVQP